MKTNPAIESLRIAITTAYRSLGLSPTHTTSMVLDHLEDMQDRVQKTLGGEVATWYGLGINCDDEHPEYYVVTTDGVIGRVYTAYDYGPACARYSWPQERLTVRKVKRLPADAANYKQDYAPWMDEWMAAAEG